MPRYGRKSVSYTHLGEVTVLHSKDKWFGVTYKEDKGVVVAAIRELLEKGAYPQKLS